MASFKDLMNAGTEEKGRNPGALISAGLLPKTPGGDNTGRSMGRTCIIRMGYSAGIVPFLILAGILLSAVPMCVSGSTPPLQPLVSVSVVDRTISPGSGIDVTAEWTQDDVVYPNPPETMMISLYKITDGSLLGTYTIPETGERGGGAIRVFRGTIPGSILPAGDVMLIATDPGSGADSRVAVSILAPGELYQDYRNRQVMEGMFYPVAAGLIIILIVMLGVLVVKRT
jgi:hypothetical protein